MNPLPNASAEPTIDPAGGAPSRASKSFPALRLLIWSVRRELWENRSIYAAPLAVATFALFGFLVRAFALPERRRALLLLDPARRQAAIEQPYDLVAILLLINALLVGLFYCLDALHGERRDRSILFWKSLPVSDRTSILAKASIPLVVLPAISFVLIVATQLIMLGLSTAILLASRLSATAWTQPNLFLHTLILLYGLVVLALWHAPLYSWLLLVSGWARRATFLWAVLPPLGIAVLERIAFNTSYFGEFLAYRLGGGIEAAFAFGPKGSVDALSQLTPGKFLATPGLWLGLACAWAFLAGAVRLRRVGGPT
jgi:ABC-2 type transport system permease protein